jgi:hypothetical protein
MPISGWGSRRPLAAASLAGREGAAQPDEAHRLRLNRGRLCPDSRHGMVKRVRRDVAVVRREARQWQELPEARRQAVAVPRAGVVRP